MARKLEESSDEYMHIFIVWHEHRGGCMKDTIHSLYGLVKASFLHQISFHNFEPLFCSFHFPQKGYLLCLPCCTWKVNVYYLRTFWEAFITKKRKNLKSWFLDMNLDLWQWHARYVPFWAVTLLGMMLWTRCLQLRNILASLLSFSPFNGGVFLLLDYSWVIYNVQSWQG